MSDSEGRQIRLRMDKRSVPSALQPVRKISVAEAIYRQLRDSIVGGELEPGFELPGERALSETLGANRGAVREALKRLEAAGLVAIHQGGHTKVLDFRFTAGLDFISQLVYRPNGDLDASILRSMTEFAVLLTPEIARLAALRREPDLAPKLQTLLAAMRSAGEDPARLQELQEEFWALLAESTENVAYQLVLNTIRELSDLNGDPKREFRSAEYRDVEGLEQIANSVKIGDPEAAERHARDRARAVAESLGFYVD